MHVSSTPCNLHRNRPTGTYRRPKKTKTQSRNPGQRTARESVPAHTLHLQRKKPQDQAGTAPHRDTGSEATEAEPTRTRPRLKHGVEGTTSSEPKQRACKIKLGGTVKYL
ncbi:Hypothetical predicted protein [Pelobates cultripes]|uniref:Uncharacterized protein n=1 Tax=Pelobates cultripes TaxID=61616 RepID=A0AAD1S4J6_PELCU|nr:Hypothetical predicted protein [Pelobates cultripes]